MEALNINLKEIIFAIVNFAILIGVLTKFLYKPTLAMFDKRRAIIAENLDKAAETNREADAKLDNYNKRIANAEEEGREIVRNAKLKAEAQAQTIVDDAKEEAAAIKANAEKDVELLRQKTMADMKKQIAALAILAAEKVIEKELQGPGQDEFVDGILEQAGTTGWQN